MDTLPDVTVVNTDISNGIRIENGTFNFKNNRPASTLKDFPCQKTDSTGQLLLTDCLVENSALEITIILVAILLILITAVVLIYFNGNKQNRNENGKEGTNYYEYDDTKKSFVETEPPKPKSEPTGYNI